MILPERRRGAGDRGDADADGDAEAEAAKKASKPKKPKALTKAQKAARADAVDEVRRQGFTTLKATDYDPRATLRVLIGRPVGDAAGGYRAFFFSKDALHRQRRARAPARCCASSRKGKRDGHAVLRRLRARRHARASRAAASACASSSRATC